MPGSNRSVDSATNPTPAISGSPPPPARPARTSAPGDNSASPANGPTNRSRPMAMHQPACPISLNSPCSTVGRNGTPVGCSEEQLLSCRDWHRRSARFLCNRRTVAVRPDHHIRWRIRPAVWVCVLWHAGHLIVLTSFISSITCITKVLRHRRFLSFRQAEFLRCLGFLSFVSID
jgi:hypothetical protein